MRATPERAYVIHEALMRFLIQEFATEDPISIITACTYEIGRVVGVLGDGLSATDREELLQAVVGVMREQIDSGLRR